MSGARLASGMFGAVAFLPLGYAAFRSLEPLWLPEGGGAGYSLLQPLSPLDVAAIVLGFTLVGVCIVLLYRLPHVETDKQRAWVMFLLFGSIFAVPIFWYLHMFRRPHVQASPGDL